MHKKKKRNTVHDWKILEHIPKSKVPDQNGVSLLYIMLEIHQSGQEPSKCFAHTFCEVYGYEGKSEKQRDTDRLVDKKSQNNPLAQISQSSADYNTVHTTRHSSNSC